TRCSRAWRSGFARAVGSSSSSTIAAPPAAGCRTRSPSAFCQLSSPRQSSRRRSSRRRGPRRSAATSTWPWPSGRPLEPRTDGCRLAFGRAPERSEGFLRAATALLDAGADPNTGFWTTGQYPELETALYGAAGVAHHAELTRLLLARGADPNDGEAVYHSPETYDNAAMQLLGELRAMGGELLAKFAGTDNAPGVALLLDLGVEVAAPFAAGDGYFDEPQGSLAIHVAAWRARPEVVRLLIARGSPTDVPDAKG